MARKLLPRGSRRRLLWLLGGLVLSQVVLAAAIDGWLGEVRDPEYADKVRRLKARLAEAPGRPLALVLGSSRTAFGLDARSLSASGTAHDPLVFNFGQMGGGPLLEGVTLRRLLDDGIRPDLLFLEVLPAHLLVSHGALLEEKMLDGTRLRAGEMLGLRRRYREPWRLASGWLLGRLLPCYRHQADLRVCLGLVRPETDGLDPWDPELVDGYGWRARSDPMSEDYRRGATEMAVRQYEEVCSATEVGEEAVRAVEDLLALCRRERIPVILVVMPEGSRFRALYTPAARAACDGVLARLQAAWGVRVVDARAWVDDVGFWDMHHMLPQGARQFGERFAREVLAPALAARPGAALRS
jgi:hypothetical protein